VFDAESDALGEPTTVTVTREALDNMEGAEGGAAAGRGGGINGRISE